MMRHPLPPASPVRLTVDLELPADVARWLADISEAEKKPVDEIASRFLWDRWRGIDRLGPFGRTALQIRTMLFGGEPT